MALLSCGRAQRHASTQPLSVRKLRLHNCLASVFGFGVSRREALHARANLHVKPDAQSANQVSLSRNASLPANSGGATKRLSPPPPKESCETQVKVGPGPACVGTNPAPSSENQSGNAPQDFPHFVRDAGNALETPGQPPGTFLPGTSAGTSSNCPGTLPRAEDTIAIAVLGIHLDYLQKNTSDQKAGRPSQHSRM